MATKKETAATETAATETAATETAATETAATETEKVEQAEKMVKIRIPRTKADQEDVFVSVNMRTWIIKRGVDVEVPACVAEVLRNQEKMLEEIMLFDDARASKN